MSRTWFGVAVVGLGLVGGLLGCDAAARGGRGAPDVEGSGLELAETDDYGVSYEGWTMHPFASTAYEWWAYQEQWVERANSWGIYFTRTSGPETRGGGVCLVQYAGGSCTTDADCGALQPNGWYHYCSAIEGDSAPPTCWIRPGTQSEMCSVGQDRSPSVIYGPDNPEDAAALFAQRTGDTIYALGCMSKSAGPSFACGVGGSSTYMRTVVPKQDEYIY